MNDHFKNQHPSWYTSASGLSHVVEAQCQTILFSRVSIIKDFVCLANLSTFVGIIVASSIF